MGAALFALVPEVCCTAWHDGGGGGGGRPFLGSSYALLGVRGGVNFLRDGLCAAGFFGGEFS